MRRPRPKSTCRSLPEDQVPNGSPSALSVRSSAGGPCVYTGRAMKPVHTGLGITAADWSVIIGILDSALDE